MARIADRGEVERCCCSRFRVVDIDPLSESCKVGTEASISSLAMESAMSAWYPSLPVKPAKMTGSPCAVMYVTGLWGLSLSISIHFESTWK